MRTLKELRSAVNDTFRNAEHRSDAELLASQVMELVAHVQQQAEQIATLTACVAALEARADARDEIDEVDAEAMLDAKDWPAPAAHPSKLDEVPIAVPGDPTVRHVVAWMRATYPQNAHAQEWAGEIERVFLSHAAPPPPAAPAPASDDYEATAKAAEKARREERAACEAVCREVATERRHRRRAADDCADRIAARGGGQ